ncbi:ABC transporter ATP-binding protein [Candidatus Kaiserbacteria bacterium]|nr:ABC transporter ATP-binding protein [Candidatus Kaiserbacteria bacterium]
MSNRIICYHSLMPVLEVKNLTKEYADVKAVSDVSFKVERGEILGLLGPNGAGKTTTINMILGVLEPTSGLVTIAEHDVAKERRIALSKTNFAAVYAQLPSNLTVYQCLRVFGLLYSVPNLAVRIDEVMEEFDLERFSSTKIGVLSSGEQTRVSLAKAMLNAPSLLLLDEPTASLDPSTARDVRERIRGYALAGKGGILWTSHNMHEVVEVCDRVLFLSHGEVLLEGDPKALPAQHEKKDLEELFIAVAREPLSLTE